MLGVCSVFFAFAQCVGLWLEPQARVSDLQAGGSDLHLHVKPCHRVKCAKLDKLSVPDCPNEVSSGDFTTDQMSDGRTIRIFCMVDNSTRECVCMEVAFSFPARRVVQVLERLIAWRGKSESFRFGNGPEFVSHKVRAWAVSRVALK